MSYPAFVCWVLILGPAFLAGGGGGGGCLVQGAPTIVTFRNVTAWGLAVPGGAGPTWCVDFNYLTTDSRIGATVRTFLDRGNITRMGLAMEPGGSTIQNDIDAAPFAFSGAVNGTTYAALWVDRDSNTRVRVTFLQTATIRAWSATFAAIGTAEALQANIVSRANATANTTTTVQDVTNGFWGFTINEDLVSILFTAKNTNGNPNTGESFSMDNVCVQGNSTGSANIPEPAPACDIAIPIIGPLLCILFSIIGGIVGGIF